MKKIVLSVIIIIIILATGFVGYNYIVYKKIYNLCAIKVEPFINFYFLSIEDSGKIKNFSEKISNLTEVEKVIFISSDDSKKEFIELHKNEPVLMNELEKSNTLFDQQLRVIPKKNINYDALEKNIISEIQKIGLSINKITHGSPDIQNTFQRNFTFSNYLFNRNSAQVKVWIESCSK